MILSILSNAFSKSCAVTWSDSERAGVLDNTYLDLYDFFLIC